MRPVGASMVNRPGPGVFAILVWFIGRPISETKPVFTRLRGIDQCACIRVRPPPYHSYSPSLSGYAARRGGRRSLRQDHGLQCVELGRKAALVAGQRGPVSVALTGLELGVDESRRQLATVAQLRVADQHAREWRSGAPVAGPSGDQLTVRLQDQHRQAVVAPEAGPDQAADSEGRVQPAVRETAKTGVNASRGKPASAGPQYSARSRSCGRSGC